MLGICLSSELNAKQFPYGIGVEYDVINVDENFEIITFQAHIYAVFTSKRKMQMHLSVLTIGSLLSFFLKVLSMSMQKVGI